jgi:Mn-dependent DtxR family transcriptional regulator
MPPLAVHYRLGVPRERKEGMEVWEERQKIILPTLVGHRLAEQFFVHILGWKR